MIAGIIFVVLAAILQGAFLLPMSWTRKWAWEQTWAVFCLLAMLVFNWILAALLLPWPGAIYRAVPQRELLIVTAFGLSWGVAAVLFGLAMDRLGLTLGYPLMMGLNASAGALAPLIWFSHARLTSLPSLIVLGGIILGVAGIVSCSLAGTRSRSSSGSTAASRDGFASGLVIAVVSGCLSCLPNIGMAYGTGAVRAARALGASDALAGNAVWCIFFTVGGLVNVVYCVARMRKKRNWKALFGPESPRDLGCSAAMALMWIGSFYLYGIGTSMVGTWGKVIGWPVFICLAIGVGVLGGWWKGEWRHAPSSATFFLRQGLLLILIAVLVLALGNSLAQETTQL